MRSTTGPGTARATRPTEPWRNGWVPRLVTSILPRHETATAASSRGWCPRASAGLGGLSEVIVSLYAGGMTIRDIQAHLERTLGTQLSHETISNITDAVAEEVLAWQSRPLDPVYPILYLDALVVKIRDNHQVRNKPALYRRRCRRRRHQARVGHLGANQ